MKKKLVFILLLTVFLFVATNAFSVEVNELIADPALSPDTAGVCFDNNDCAVDYYCEKRLGDCDGIGNCTIKPEICIFIFAPVCGCDGNEYSNDCIAAAAGVNVLNNGECQQSEQFSLGEVFSLYYQETKSNTEENIDIIFKGVLSDGRCPIEARCIWEGNAEVEFIFLKNDLQRSFVLNTGIEPSEISLFGYDIKLQGLEPPASLANPPAEEDYIAALVITKTDKQMYGRRCKFDKCDDGSKLICDMIQPDCNDNEISALQDGCWSCVNPDTCVPWGVPECFGDEECPYGMWCNPCGSSSCLFCDDCVPACEEITY